MACIGIETGLTGVGYGGEEAATIMSSPSSWSPELAGQCPSRDQEQFRERSGNPNFSFYYGQQPHRYHPMELLESQALDLSELAQRSTTATDAQAQAQAQAAAVSGYEYNDSPGGPRSASVGGDNSAQAQQGQKRKSFEGDDGNAASSKQTRAKRNRVSNLLSQAARTHRC